MARKSSESAITAPTTVATQAPALIQPSATSTQRQPPFLMWYDDNPKTPITQKIAAAIAAYKTRFPGVEPTLVLVNETEVAFIEGITVRGTATVSRHTYWVGQTIAG